MIVSNRFSSTCASFKHTQALSRSFNEKAVLTHKNTGVIQDALKTISKKDAFSGLQIDFTALPLIENVIELKIFKEAIYNEIEEQKRNGIHVMGVKVLADQSTIMKIFIDCGFRHHHANDQYSLLNLCLKGHSVKECSFPAFRTVSAGVTAVVFSQDMKEVLVVTEQTGPIKKFKPPTGGIDYGVSEDTPLKAVIRELKEETQIDVDPSSAIVVGSGWSNNYRGTNPDISYIFAFVLDKMQQPIAQESEIAKAKWVLVEEFMKEPDEEKGKPWLLRQAVVAGYQAVTQSKNPWKAQTLYLSNKKPVEFFSALNRE